MTVSASMVANCCPRLTRTTSTKVRTYSRYRATAIAPWFAQLHLPGTGSSMKAGELCGRRFLPSHPSIRLVLFRIRAPDSCRSTHDPRRPAHKLALVHFGSIYDREWRSVNGVQSRSWLWAIIDISMFLCRLVTWPHIILDGNFDILWNTWEKPQG